MRRETLGRCGNCGNTAVDVFYTVERVPVHSCVLLADQSKALSFPTGDISLGLCPTCGLIQNRVFDLNAVDYSGDYEDSQAHSAHFISFATALIDRLDAKYDITGKHVVEIGCGKGDFLVLLSNRLATTGLGIDPAYRSGPIQPDHPDRVKFDTTPFSSGRDLGDPALIVCRHTLEHLPEVATFLKDLRASIEDPGTIVFFEVPDSARILKERAFWDIYYEHASYFVEESLRTVFEACGFEVLESWYGMDDQYLMLTARPSATSTMPRTGSANELRQATSGFAEDVAVAVARMRGDLGMYARRGSTVLWGASSKAVSYLHALSASDEIAAVVDINPVKHGRFLAGSGTPVVGPDDLIDIGPSTVIPMNPVYTNEIRQDLRSRSLDAEVESLSR